MKDTATTAEPVLVLHPITRVPEGGVLPLRLEGQEPLVVGRSPDMQWAIPDQVMSRRHAMLERRGAQWFVSDLQSRHGTFVNGRRLEGTERAPLRSGDHLRFGQWACRCRDAADAGAAHTIVDDAASMGALSRVSEARGLAGLAQQRLDALLAACRELQNVSNRDELACALARCASEGTGCPRALVMRQVGADEYEVLASTIPEAEPRLSRSLLDAARGGRLVQLSGMPQGGAGAQSVIDLNIRSAICAPLMLGEAVDGYLYLDTRGVERALCDDGAAFCQSLAQVGGLSLERLLRAELQAHRSQLESDLAAARRAQELLMPIASAVIGGVRYTFESSAGRLVAGDFFDAVALDEHRCAFFLGDVSGKGVGAAILMAAAQAELRVLLERGTALAEAMGVVNAFLHARTASDKFITMIAGVIDAGRGVAELVDAGHGLCCLCRQGEAPRLVRTEGGLPLGVVEDGGYVSEPVEVRASDRLVVFSDGVVEQTDPGGAQFGVAAVLQMLGSCTGPDDDVAVIARAVRDHAQGPLADDLTVASLQVMNAQ